MKRLITLTATITTLAGCAGPMCHSTKSPTDFERDKRYCMNSAAAVASSWGSPGNPFMIADEANNCMQMEKGWYRCNQ